MFLILFSYFLDSVITNNISEKIKHTNLFHDDKLINLEKANVYNEAAIDEKQYTNILSENKLVTKQCKKSGK